jgi:hypothetical protein
MRRAPLDLFRYLSTQMPQDHSRPRLFHPKLMKTIIERAPRRLSSVERPAGRAPILSSKDSEGRMET